MVFKVTCLIMNSIESGGHKFYIMWGRWITPELGTRHPWSSELALTTLPQTPDLCATLSIHMHLVQVIERQGSAKYNPLIYWSVPGSYSSGQVNEWVLVSDEMRWVSSTLLTASSLTPRKDGQRAIQSWGIITSHDILWWSRGLSSLARLNFKVIE